tara:strand:+ start:538 stop:954 length:417 start_codon:yes stop_codon:yes gene_type:complete
MMSEHTTDKHNPLISIKEFPDDGRLQIINSYGQGGFKIAKKIVIGAQFVLQRQTLAWPVRTEQDISADELLSFLQDTDVDLLVLGLGEYPQSHLPDIASALRNEGIKLEVMSTAAACRTWNVLLTEGRTAAAGLLAVE